MKLYNLSLEENKLVSAIINDLTKPYKANICTRQYEKFANDGIQMVRSRAVAKGLLLSEADWEIPVKDLKAIVTGAGDGQAS